MDTKATLLKALELYLAGKLGYEPGKYLASRYYGHDRDAIGVVQMIKKEAVRHWSEIAVASPMPDTEDVLIYHMRFDDKSVYAGYSQSNDRLILATFK